MRRVLCTAAVVLGLAALSAGQAAAAVSGTAHAGLNTSGDCAACHIPHAAVGDRLWPGSLTTAATWGTIGPFCYYCHSASGGGAITAAAHDSGVFATTAHGVGATTNPDGNAANTASLPYSDTNGIECTSCHNPHDDTNRPFLRVSQDALCQLCHPNRGASNAAFSGYGTSNPGYHPVGTNVTGDNDGTGNSPIVITPLGMRTWGSVADYRSGPSGVGGAATLASGLACGSCHAVHGVESADGGQMLANTPNEDLLALDNGGDMGGHHNGGQGTADANGLCEACHDTGATTYDAGAAANYAGTLNPNPGGTAYTHPVDDLGSANEAVSAFPSSWPYSTTTPGAGTIGGALCESCHMPHPRQSTVAQTSSPATVTSGTHILRNSDQGICDDCHTGVVADHHPTSVPMGGYTDNDINTGVAATLECGDCHSGNGAHNWLGASQVGLNPNWEPTQNARGSADAIGQNGTFSGPNGAVALSKECVDCHNSRVSTGAPTNNSANDNSVVRGTEYQDAGEGTHWIGTNGSAGAGVTYASGTLNDGTSLFNATTTAWTAGGWSRWGTNDGDVVCESCHELEPDKNATGSALLLHPYTEGRAVSGDTSDFCQGCHGVTPGGGTPHPMTDDVITKARDSGVGPDGTTSRSTTTLITFATTASYMTANMTGNTTIPATNQMNCDSCHQPHDTPTTAGTWILDTPSANVPTGAAAGNVSPASANYQAFCIECHAY